MTKRTLYTYYGDKAGLFAAMVTDLAATVSLDATSDDDTLEVLAARIVSRVHSDELVGLHRLVIAESARFPELALILHSSGDARHIARLAEHIRAERGPASEPLAEPLFSLLLGEKHRRRLLGIDPAPTPPQAAAHARRRWRNSASGSAPDRSRIPPAAGQPAAAGRRIGLSFLRARDGDAGHLVRARCPGREGRLGSRWHRQSSESCLTTVVRPGFGLPAFGWPRAGRSGEDPVREQGREGSTPPTSDQRAPGSCPTQPTIGPPIGVEPSQARPHSAITRPRISGVAASCSTVFAIELNVIEPYPTNSSAASSSGIDGAIAATQIAIPQPIEARQSARPPAAPWPPRPGRRPPRRPP